MADTSAQNEAEKWIRQVALPEIYRQDFDKRRLTLRGNGEFQFDAVSSDGSIVACISTSAGFTVTGKRATAKVQKIRSDVLWFYMLPKLPDKPLLVFTEKTLLDMIQKEKDNGRFPPEFELLRVELPPDLTEMVAQAQEEASREVSPH